MVIIVPDCLFTPVPHKVSALLHIHGGTTAIIKSYRFARKLRIGRHLPTVSRSFFPNLRANVSAPSPFFVCIVLTVYSRFH